MTEKSVNLAQGTRLACHTTVTNPQKTARTCQAIEIEPHFQSESRSSGEYRVKPTRVIISAGPDISNSGLTLRHSHKCGDTERGVARMSAILQFI